MRTRLSMLRSIWASTILLFLVTTTALADVSLQNNRWELLSVPADGSSTTIASIFSDDLPDAEYNISWAVFRFDMAQQSYIQAALSDSLAQGEGFWIIQMTGNDVTVDIPANLPEGVALDSLPCASPDGCYSKKLATSTTADFLWSLVGSPYLSSINTFDLRLTSSEDQCALGYDIEESVLEGYLKESPWAYDSGSGQYVPLDQLVSIEPWRGFWVPTVKQQTSIGLYMLIPNPGT